MIECPHCRHDYHIELEATLAEREAQIAYLVGWIQCDHHQPQPPSFVCSHTRDKLRALNDAARTFVERAKAEGAEEMREQIIAVVLDGQASEGDPPIVRERLARVLDRIAAAIRTLDAGDPAARRG